MDILITRIFKILLASFSYLSTVIITLHFLNLFIEQQNVKNKNRKHMVKFCSHKQQYANKYTMSNICNVDQLIEGNFSLISQLIFYRIP